MKRRRGRIVSLTFGMVILLIVLGIQFLAGCDSSTTNEIFTNTVYKNTGVAVNAAFNAQKHKQTK